jgi:hypothetical protein
MRAKYTRLEGGINKHTIHLLTGGYTKPGPGARATRALGLKQPRGGTLGIAPLVVRSHRGT